MNTANLVGLLYILPSFPLIYLQLITLAVFTTQSEYRQLTCFRIMLSIGVLDILQLLVHCINGVAMLNDHLFEGWPKTVLGGMLFSSWMVMTPQHLLLAVNRLLVVRKLDFSPQTMLSKRERAALNVSQFPIIHCSEMKI